MSNRDTAQAVERVRFVLGVDVVDELVDWRNWRARAAVACAPYRVGSSTRLVVSMRRDDTRDLIRYLERLAAAHASLTPEQARHVDPAPIRRTVRRLRRLPGIRP